MPDINDQYRPGFDAMRPTQCESLADDHLFAAIYGNSADRKADAAIAAALYTRSLVLRSHWTPEKAR